MEKRIKAAFAEIDADHTGHIGVEAFMRACGTDDADLVHKLFDLVDEDHSGQVEKKELVHALRTCREAADLAERCEGLRVLLHFSKTDHFLATVDATSKSRRRKNKKKKKQKRKATTKPGAKQQKKKKKKKKKKGLKRTQTHHHNLGKFLSIVRTVLRWRRLARTLERHTQGQAAAGGGVNKNQKLFLRLGANAKMYGSDDEDAEEKDTLAKAVAAGRQAQRARTEKLIEEARQAGESGGDADAASPWIKKIDPASKRPYWANRLTKTSTWTKPPELD